MMLKQFFALAILSHSVFCRFTPNERQLVANADQGTGNEWQYCNDTCTDVCEPCVVHNECKDGEKLCGYGPVRTGSNGIALPECPKDEKCVSNNCACPVTDNNGNDCPVICECDCDAETQLCCPGGVDESTGCKQEDTCHSKGRGVGNKICEGFCPVECDGHENFCEQDPDSDGCKVKPECEDKKVGDNNKYCDVQQCTLKCKHTEHLCHGDETVDGCMELDKCVPKQQAPTQPIDVMCPGTCPIECENGQELCDGTIDYSGGIHQHCIGQPGCRIKALDTNGQYCEENSDSHGCPVTCPPDEILCPSKLGPLACKEEKKCHQRTWTSDQDYCAETADCPTICPPNHVNCPGGIEENTCKAADLCIKEHRDFNDDVCPVHCPENCKDDEVFCPGTKSPINGCFSRDTCEKKDDHKWGPTEGSECPGWCPVICLDHEVLCPSYIDPCNGCPTEEICREAIKNTNGKFCPGKEYTLKEEQEDYRTNLNRRGGFLSASHNCPVYCKEWNGEVQCPVYEDALGCKPAALCVERQIKSENVDGSVNEYCPATSVCPRQCPSNQKLCHYEENDEDGCHHEDVCVDIDTDSYGAPCQMDWCPPLCRGAEALQNNGEDENGCNKASTCVVPA